MPAYLDRKDEDTTGPHEKDLRISEGQATRAGAANRAPTSAPEACDPPGRATTRHTAKKIGARGKRVERPDRTKKDTIQGLRTGARGKLL